MRLEVRSGDDSWSTIAPLVALVYPPEVMATIIWRDVTWAHADQRVLVYDDEQLVSVAGIYLRDGGQTAVRFALVELAV